MARKSTASTTRQPKDVKRQKVSRQQTEIDSDPWLDVVKRTWRVFVLSSVKDFDSSLSALRPLRQSLTSTLRSTAALSDAMVDVSALPNKAIVITVNASARTTVAILCGDTIKPLLLLRGSAITAEHVIDWVRSKFSCYAAVMKLPSFALAALLQRWVETTSQTASQTHSSIAITLEWPAGVVGVKQASISLDTTAAMKLAEQTDGDIMSGIRQHFFEHFRVNIAALHLTRIATGIALLSNDGKLKVCIHIHDDDNNKNIADAAAGSSCTDSRRHCCCERKSSTRANLIIQHDYVLSVCV